MKRLALAATLLVWFAGLAPGARALDRLPVELDHETWLGFSLRLGIPQTGESDTSFLVFTPRFDALFPVGDGAIAVQWGASLLTGEGESRFVVTNAFVGYAMNPRPTLRFTPGIVLPFAQVSDDLDDALEQIVTYAATASAHAAHELWLYAPETFSIIAPLHSDLPLSDTVTLESDATVALMFPSQGEDDIELAFDFEVTALISVVRIGIGAFLLATGDGDNAVVSASLGARFPVGRGRLWADILFTLDEPNFLDDGAIPSVGVGYASPF